MDIDFIVQDSFALTRPQWKLAPNLEEAGRAFAEAVKNTYKVQEVEKQIEPEESDEEYSDGDADDEDIPVPDMEDGQSSGDEADADVDISACSLFLYMLICFRSQRLTKMRNVTLTSRKTLLSPARKKSVILRPKLSLTENFRR